MAATTQPDLGYIFYPGQSYFGEERFDVVLRREPTNEHFDPEKVHLKVKSHRNVQELDIQHPWRQQSEQPLCPGHIRIVDRFHKFIDLFSFGGSVQITAVSHKTTCAFTSPAPFLDMTTGHVLCILFANEVDILLAQERARLNLRFPAEFDSKLANIDPFAFYVSCLQALRKKFADNTIYSDPAHQHFRHDLNLEIARLQNENSWPSSIPPLADLLT
jgi:hypothetical protein